MMKTNRFNSSRYNFIFQKLRFLKHKITRSDGEVIALLEFLEDFISLSSFRVFFIKLPKLFYEKCIENYWKQIIATVFDRILHFKNLGIKT